MAFPCSLEGCNRACIFVNVFPEFPSLPPPFALGLPFSKLDMLHFEFVSMSATFLVFGPSSTYFCK